LSASTVTPYFGICAAAGAAASAAQTNPAITRFIIHLSECGPT
jgi:hypothetical protein